MSSLVLQQFNHELTALIERIRHSTAMVSGMSIDLLNGSGGSAWLFDTQGHLVTNHHVVADIKRSLRVQFAGKPEIPAVVVGSDPSTDLAVLRVDLPVTATALALRPAVPALGELCMAMGAPLRFRESVSLGIVSGLHRQLTLPDGVLEEVVQTDAAINPGNSGGPLIDMAGLVIGVNVAKRGDADNIGFAICSEMVADVVPELIAHGGIERGTFGLTVGEVMDVTGHEDPMIVVQRVRTAPSLFEVGDIIISIDAHPIRRRYDIRKLLHRGTIGTTKLVEIKRAGALHTLNVPVMQRQHGT
jgi:S1-C subfamily serine protease